MKYKVMNREAASRYSSQIDIPTIIISITDPNSLDNTFANNTNIIDVLRLKFFDVDFDEPGHIEKEDAEKIIEFINKYINKIDQIIVHCEGGVSRSSGVCAAIMKIIDGNDWAIFNNSKYVPNRACYHTILTSYFGGYDEKEVDEKIAHNIKLWRKANELD